MHDQDAAGEANTSSLNLFSAEAVQVEGVEPPTCDQSIHSHCNPNKRLAGMQLHPSVHSGASECGRADFGAFSHVIKLTALNHSVI